MNRTLDNIRIAMAIAAIFILTGLVASGFWWLFELVTNYSANLAALAGF